MAWGEGRISRGGFSLAEVVMALMILSVGMAGSAALQLVSVRMVEEARWRESVLSEVRSVLDSLAAAPSPGGGTRSLGPTRIRWSVQDGGIDLAVIREDGAGTAAMTFRGVVQ